jgi:bifunctional non-homologous end joining protein LigD
LESPSRRGRPCRHNISVGVFRQSAATQIDGQPSQEPPEHIRLSDELRGTKDELLRVTQELGLEGLVGKRRSSVYESGRRSGAWVKFKITKSQEFIIGGYTLLEGGRKYFGSLLVGYHGPGGLVFAEESALVFRTRSREALRASFRN